MRLDLALGTALVVSACSAGSSSSTSPEGGADGVAPAEAAAPNDGPGSGGDDAGSAGDADDGPVVCNALVNSAQPVTPMQIAAAAPAFQGGSIADGTYALTSEAIYTGPGGATGPTTPQTVTIQITAGTIHVSKDSSPPTSTYVLTLTGTTYSAAGECPPLLGGLVGSYTATATTFVVSLAAPGSDGGAPTTVETFTKQ